MLGTPGQYSADMELQSAYREIISLAMIWNEPELLKQVVELGGKLENQTAAYAFAAR